MKNKNNNCRFDIFLALITFLCNTDDTIFLIFQNAYTYKLLLDSILLINNHQFAKAQNSFVSALKKINFENSNLGAAWLQEIQPLFHYFLNSSKFNVVLLETRKCSNKDCLYAYKDKITNLRPPFVYTFQDNRIISKSILDNFFNTSLLVDRENSECSCNGKSKSKSKKLHLTTVDTW